MIRAVVAAAAMVLCVASGSVVAGPLDLLENDFEAAIGRIVPATVECRPWRVDSKRILSVSSGVVVSRRGLILSDGDVGIWFEGSDAASMKPVYSDDIEVRVPNLRGKGFRSFKAKVLHRNRDRNLDTSILRVEGNIDGVFGQPIGIGSSDDLRVGDFVFAAGMDAAAIDAQAPPTLKAGIVASLTPVEGTSASGRLQTFHISPAATRGMNGGPVVDAEGKLVGTISTFVPPNDPHQYLGRVVPIDALRAEYRSRPEGAEAFPERAARAVRTRQSARLELVFHGTARKAASRALVSIDVDRAEGRPLLRVEPGQGGLVPVPGWSASVSGILLPDRLHVATCLYNLANIAEGPFPGIDAHLPEPARLAAGIGSITALRVHLADGASTPATLVGHSPRDNLALLKLDSEAPASFVPPEPTERDDADSGRFVLALGCPYGVLRGPDPLLTFGVISKAHGPDIAEPWAGYLQTDAGITDGNSGGLAIDIQGRWIGMLTIWSPISHGRNSGIGFVLPAQRVLDVATALAAGRKLPWMGVEFEEKPGGLLLKRVLDGGPAAMAGLRANDRVVSIAGTPVNGLGAVRRALRTFWSGDTIEVRAQRAGESLPPVSLVLGAAPNA